MKSWLPRVKHVTTHIVRAKSRALEREWQGVKDAPFLAFLVALEGEAPLGCD